MSNGPGTRVLFVCMGNICRSPTAQGVFEKLLRDEAPQLAVEVDSAGTHAYHVGEPPDRRAQAAARRRGVELSSQRARAIAVEDFGHFDWILAMDEENLERLHARCPAEHRERVRLFMSFAPQTGARAVPDPYYGGADGFETVLDLVEAASRGLLGKLRSGAGAGR